MGLLIPTASAAFSAQTVSIWSDFYEYSTRFKNKSGFPGRLRRRNEQAHSLQFRPTWYHSREKPWNLYVLAGASHPPGTLLNKRIILLTNAEKQIFLSAPPVTGVGVSFCWKAGTVKRGIFAQRKGSGQKIQRVKSYHKDEETVTILCQFHP